MLAKFRRLSFSSTPCTVQFTIELQDLTINEIRDEITLICVELERKSKTVSSSSKMWTEKTAPSQFIFNESLILIVTLYRDAGGGFIEKKAKIILRGHSKIIKAAIPLASLNLKLHSLAANFNSQVLKLQLKDAKGTVFAVLNSTVTTKFLKDVTLDDDMSIMSGESEGGSMASSFSLQHTLLYKDSYDSQLKCEDMSKTETDKLRQSIRNTRNDLDTSSVSNYSVLRDLEQSTPLYPPSTPPLGPIILGGRRRGKHKKK